MKSKQALTALIALLVVASAVPMPAAAASGQTPDVVQYHGEQSYIVEYTNDSYNSVSNWANASDSRHVIEHYNTSNQVVVSAPTWELTGGLFARLGAGSLRAMTADALSEKSYINSLEPNYKLSKPESPKLINGSNFQTPTEGTFAFDDPAFSKSGLAFGRNSERAYMNESRAAIGADNTTATGANVTVAVIDTGANTANGRVFGNGSSGSDIRIKNASATFVGAGVTTVNESGYSAIEDGNGHGTWTASAIGANATGTVHDGVAPDASLLVLRALDDEGSGSTADIAHAIRYAADHNASVISMSLGSPVYSQELADAIEYAHDNGVSAVVVAAGNSRQSVRWVATPADAENTIAVAATNGSEPTNAGAAYFSQIGPDPGTTDNSDGATQGARIDVAAPGVKTVALTPTTSGATQNETLSGTSMATPMVAGGIAAALEANPTWEGDEATVQKWVRDGARPIPNAGPTEVGQGMFAVDNTIDENVPAQSQEEAMTDAAKTRNSFYETMSDSSGGLLPLFAEPAAVGA